MNVFYYEIIGHYKPDQIFEVDNDNQTIEETCKKVRSIIREHHLGISI